MGDQRLPAHLRRLHAARGRAADLLGRRQILIAGTSLFALASRIGGLAGSAGMLVGARLAQGAGAAMMLPAALSILTTTFSAATGRNTALGAWGAMAGLGAAVGVFLGGVLCQVLVRVRASSVNFRDPVIARRDRQSGGADGWPMSITVVSISDVFRGGPDG